MGNCKANLRSVLTISCSDVLPEFPLVKDEEYEMMMLYKVINTILIPATLSCGSPFLSVVGVLIALTK